jgi:NAD(P)H dehydrogenase (quinone)
MILITGATGHFGKSTIDFLLKKNFPASQIAALVRDPAKAADLKAKGIDLRKGDYKNYQSLVAAFKGVDTLFLISSNDVVDRSTQHINAVNAAKEAGVKRIVFTSFQRKTEVNSPIQFLAQSYIDTEKHLKASGLTYTILKNGLYADVLPMFLGEKVLETGIFFPAGATKAAFTLRSDMTEAAANVLAGSGHDDKTYELATEDNNSLGDVAALLSELSGKQIPYINPTAEVFKDALVKASVPADMIGMSAGFAEAIRIGEFTSTKTDLEKLLGHKPTALKEFLRGVYSSK